MLIAILCFNDVAVQSRRAGKGEVAVVLAFGIGQTSAPTRVGFSVPRQIGAAVVIASLSRVVWVSFRHLALKIASAARHDRVSPQSRPAARVRDYQKPRC